MTRIARFIVQHPWLSLIAAGLMVVIGGFLVMASGIVPTKASAGHWAVTEWMLQFAKRRSVTTYSLLAPQPPQDLDSAAMVMRGAGHFEIGCRPCHGGPGDPLPRIAEAMLPPPPRLGDRMASWDAPELFTIVKHGLKFTGMPAWPADQRDDEVWAVVGFLRRLPQLDGQGYQQLVQGEGTSLTELFPGTTPVSSPPDIVVEVCARCHGRDGRGRGVGAFPSLAGQRLGYLMNSMHAFAARDRHSGIMGLAASGLTDAARHAALSYYASLPLPARSATAPDDAGPMQRGAIIATRGVPEQDIPACVTCHAPSATINDNYPILAGQYREYLVQQLRLLQQRRRGGTAYVHIMHNFVDRLSAEQIDDVSTYFALNLREP